MNQHVNNLPIQANKTGILVIGLNSVKNMLKKRTVWILEEELKICLNLRPTAQFYSKKFS